jgi:diguanylate cyclase (GGDEF)-like protein/hemerythrin-like metal-binding protein
VLNSEFDRWHEVEPDGPAEVLRAFMQYPHPLVLSTLEGTTLLSNVAWSEHFGSARVVPQSVQGLPPADGGEYPLVVHVPDRDADADFEARAWVLRMPDRILLMFAGSSDPQWRLEAEKLRSRVSELELLATTDHMTGAWNRAHFERLVEVELARSLECHCPVSLVLLDIDHFKQVNDTYGHSVGDAVLRELVQAVQTRLRPSDILFRWGGEEFAVLVCAAGYRGAERLARDLCAALASRPFPGAGKLTVSVGVAEHCGAEDHESWFGRLDEALYEAKRTGRNRVVVDRRGNSDAWADATSSSPLLLPWREAYECGDPTIDHAHRQLFAMANDLIDAMFRRRADARAVRQALDALVVHVRHHFAEEEAVLASHQYAELEQHRRAHAGLLRRADYLTEQAQTGTVSLGAVVEFVAQDVIARHILTVDRAFFPLFHSG